MNVPLRQRALATALIVPTALLVIVIAVLQYRWSNQVSSATSVRLADSLQMSMINWHLNLFRDLSDICAVMGIDVKQVGRPELDQQLKRFADWRAAAPYPDLVSSISILPSGDRAQSALRWDVATGRLERPRRPTSVERAMGADGRQGLDVSNMASPLANARTSGLAYPLGGLDGWRFEPAVPAMLRPISASADLLDDAPRGGRTVAAWLIIELNADVIRTRVLPDLANRYFTGADGLDYQVALVAGAQPRTVIYSSDPDFAIQDPTDADGRMNLFGRPLGKAARSPIDVFHQPSVGLGPATSVGTSWFPLLRQDTAAADDWQLVVRHRRGGPLGTFVTDVRRRDLAVSFGALLLFVVSMTMWIIVSNRAQRLAKLQMDFVTAVSHDLRTPLTIISSAADNIAQGIVHQQPQLAQYGSVIGTQARKLSELVEQVLLFASIREARQRYRLRPVDVADVIDTTVTAVSALIDVSAVRVEREVAADIPLVLGDPLGLSQCLQNLITNALKYGGHQRWIGIRALHVADGMGSEIQISVSDRGIGIEAAELPHIFDPFYRSPSVASVHHGTGLGLTVARSIAEAMNGQLTVTSIAGVGSTFTLHLPCVREVGPDAEPAVAV